MNIPNNMRSKATRQKLRDALVECMLGAQLSNIRINKLCKIAGVGRSTFYEHYESIDDLVLDLQESFATELKKAIGTLGDSADSKEALRRMVVFFSVNGKAFQALFKGPGTMKFQREFSNFIIEEINTIYYQKKESTMFPFTLRYATYGTLYCIGTWIDSGCLLPIDDFTEKLYLLIKSSLEAEK